MGIRITLAVSVFTMHSTDYSKTDIIISFHNSCPPTVFLQPEQNCSAHVGQCTKHGVPASALLPLPLPTAPGLFSAGSTDTARPPLSPAGPASRWSAVTRQTVSHPAFGHHVRVRSRSTSVHLREERKHIDFKIHTLFVISCCHVFYVNLFDTFGSLHNCCQA